MAKIKGMKGTLIKFGATALGLFGVTMAVQSNSETNSPNARVEELSKSLDYFYSNEVRRGEVYKPMMSNSTGTNGTSGNLNPNRTSTNNYNSNTNR